MTASDDPCTLPWCVAWRDRATGKQGWCMTYRNRAPSEDAVHDQTACGYTVHLRGGEQRGEPTCSECQTILRRRRARRGTQISTTSAGSKPSTSSSG
jgi:hypothetical protein